MKIGITLGDPAGVGPEVVVKALKKIGTRNYLVIGPDDVFQTEARKQQLALASVNLIDTGAVGRYQFGRVQKNCGAAAFAALRQGVALLQEGEIAALVTAPVSKAALRLAGFSWPGQTEFLAAMLGCRRFAMLAWTPRFKVIFVTIHLPIARVPLAITTAGVREKIVLLHRFLQQEGKRQPRIGVFALNPHGEEFSLGEEKKIARALRQAGRQRIRVSGPLPADTVFAHLDEFDGFVAMFHDQAMIPAKLIAGGAGVNVTLGLPRIRTSPLHGVAFDIAGRGVASARSMIAALQLARRITCSQLK